MGISWSTEVDIEEVGIILNKTVNELRTCAVSIVKTTIDCVKRVIGWIDKLTRNSPQLDYESRRLLENLGEDLEKLKSDANRVLQSCKDLAEVASDEYQISRIKEEVNKRSGLFRRVLIRVQNKFFPSQTSSELKMFLNSVHDRILVCTDAVNVFYRHYGLLLGNIERVINAKRSKLSELEKRVQDNSTTNAVARKVAMGGLISSVICWTAGAVVIVLTGGAAARVVALGLMASGCTAAGGVIASNVSEKSLLVSLSEYKYLEDILQGVLSIQKEMNTIKTSVKAMDACVNNAKDVLNDRLNEYAELSSYRDVDRDIIEASLDDLCDYMKDLIDDIESCDWQP